VLQKFSQRIEIKWWLDALEARLVILLLNELVQQHRVHLIVTDAVGFPFVVVDHQSGIHFPYILRYKANLRGACWINFLFVM